MRLVGAKVVTAAWIHWVPAAQEWGVVFLMGMGVRRLCMWRGVSPKGPARRVHPRPCLEVSLLHSGRRSSYWSAYVGPISDLCPPTVKGGL